MMSELHWVGSEARRQLPEVINDVELHIRTARLDADRDILPLGNDFSNLRIESVKAVGQTIVEFASVELGVDVKPPLADVSQNFIRFYNPDDYAEATKVAGVLAGTRGFTTDLGFVAVLETVDAGVDLYYTLHELLHKSAYDRYAMRQNLETHKLDVELRHTGIINLGKTSRFMALDEGMIVSLTDKVKDAQWPEHDLLAPHADLRNPLLNEKGRAKGEYPTGVVLSAIFKVMCEQASQEVGEDVESAFYKAHFGGGQEPLRYLSRTFGNQAVTALSYLGNRSEQADVDNFIEMIDIRRELMDGLAEYRSDSALEKPNWYRRLVHLLRKN